MTVVSRIAATTFSRPPQLIGVQVQAALTELLTEDAVLLLQVLDDVFLLPVDPAREREQCEVERVPHRGSLATAQERS